LNELSKLGVEVVRYTVRWDQVAPRRPQDARDPSDEAYDWAETDGVFRGLRRHGIDPVVTLFGTPSWANGGRGPNWVPSSSRSFASFAYAAGRRYPWIRYWTIWNEPNRPTFLRPTTPKAYVSTLLNPAYAELHSAIGRVQVGGGVTAPRAGDGGGVAPVAWIRGMSSAHAKLDAYAHHPYPGSPGSETPWGPKCVNCQTITMADLERLEREVRRAFGHKPIWLTEYGYQTNPPDRIFGVTLSKQAKYLTQAVAVARANPRIDLFLWFLLRDEQRLSGWQSGLTTFEGKRKPSFDAFRRAAASLLAP